MGQRFIFDIQGLTKLYGKVEIFKDVRLSFFPGAKIGVLGSNGAGKSTLLRIMAGVDKEFMGTARPEAGASIGYVPQEPYLKPGTTVLQNIEEAVEPVRGLIAKFETVSEKFADPDADFEKLSNEMDRIQAQIDATNAHDIDRQLELAMDAMRLPPPDALVDRLSGGERRRVFLCKTLLQNHDLLLLDEPTNHLDAESVYWLEQHLKQYKGAIVAVTHDRYFLDNVAQWILELDHGRGYPVRGELHVVDGAEAEAVATRGAAGERPAEAPGPRAGVGEEFAEAPAWPRARPAWRRSTRCRRKKWKTATKS